MRKLEITSEPMTVWHTSMPLTHTHMPMSHTPMTLWHILYDSGAAYHRTFIIEVDQRS